MVEVRKATWTGVEWRLLVRVYEGVYHEEAYPVTLTYLGSVDDETEVGKRLRQVLAQVVEELVRRQLRLGSLPPRGMLSNWREIVDRRFPADRLGPIRDLMATLDESVGMMIQTNGHGYYHPIQREPLSARVREVSAAPNPDTPAVKVATPSHPAPVPDASKGHRKSAPPRGDQIGRGGQCVDRPRSSCPEPPAERALLGRRLPGPAPPCDHILGETWRRRKRSHRNAPSCVQPGAFHPYPFDVPFSSAGA